MDEDGFLVVRAALDQETVARATEAVDRLAHAFLNKPVVLDRPEYNQLDLRPGLLREEALFELVANSLDGSPRGSIDGPQYSPPFHGDHLQAARESGLAVVPSRMASGHPHGSRPGTRGPAAGRDQDLLLPDRFSLDRCGMTLMARKTHLREEPLAIPKGQVDPSGVEVCDLRLDAGDAAVLREPNLPHRGAESEHPHVEGSDVRVRVSLDEAGGVPGEPRPCSCLPRPIPSRGNCSEDTATSIPRRGRCSDGPIGMQSRRRPYLGP